MVLQSQCLCHRSNKSVSVRLSFILSYQTTKITKSHITNRHSHRTDVTTFTVTQPEDDGLAHGCAGLIYKVIWPTSQTGGQPWMPTLTKACDIPDRATPVWQMEESSRHTIPFSREGFRYEDVTLTFTSRQAGRLGLDRQVDLDSIFSVWKIRNLKPSFHQVLRY